VLGGPPERLGSPDRVLGGPQVPPRPMPAQAGPPQHDPYGRYDEPTGTFSGGFDAPPRGYDGPGGPGGAGGPGPGGPGLGGPGRGPTFGGPDDRFEGFEPGRHGKMDMTAEIRLPERESRGGGQLGGPPMGGPGMGGPGMGGGPAPLAGPPGSELARVDQMRRSFQVRRFGSGYDPDQVDRLFEGVIAGMTGRGPMPASDHDLDSTQFGLVPGGYFEAEVDAALKQVRDILRRR
jgi:hypothetical protein